MYIFKQRFILIFLFIVLILSMSSCGSKSKTLEIIYDSNGGTQVESQILTIGERFSLPKAPTKEGYTFNGWYIDNQTYITAFTNIYDLSSVKTKTLTVYATWSIYEYLITFNTNGGSLIAPISQTLTHPMITKPADPTKAGYTFKGWYTNTSLTAPYTFGLSSLIGNLTLYAKWELVTYTMTFNTNGGSTLAPISRTVEQSSIIRPENPTKEGYTFIGWYKDVGLTEVYTFSLPINENVTLYAKWEVVIIDNGHLATDELSIFSAYYGNTNGNLNNLGLAVYDIKLKLHYLSYQSSVYAYNPATDQTSILFTLTSGARATFLNLDGDVLYFIDTDEGYLLSYHLIDHTFKTLSETENIYASRVQNWVNIVYPTIMYEQNYVAFQRYLINTQTLSPNQGYGFEQLNYEGTRIYYKPIDSFSLNVMNYNGAGKSTIINLTPLGVTKQYETLLYKVNQDYVSYFALILEIGQSKGLYLYNSIDGLVKVMDGSVHSLNYDGNKLYAISGSGLYQIDLTLKTPTLIHTLTSNDLRLNIINHWFYLSSPTGLTSYRINPVTQEVENIID